jgi:dynein heavy chain 1
MKDLAKAEPAVQEAKLNVSNIKKQHLTELRSMGNPPDAVKLTMEAVCIMLGNDVDSWKAVQSVLRKDDFINNIVGYDTDRMMTKSMRSKILQEYMAQDSFNFETVNRASKACGPLVAWIIAQVNYSDILDKIGPLREEVNALEKKANSTKLKVSEMRDKITSLESSILTIKDEYASLISQTQEIKQEMDRVKSKVERSVTLLGNISWNILNAGFLNKVFVLIRFSFE